MTDRGKRRLLSFSLERIRSDVAEMISIARALPSPTSFLSPSALTNVAGRHEVAPPADTPYPNLADFCYREYNAGMSGMNIDIEEESSAPRGVRPRCFSKNIYHRDVTVRGILASRKECRCSESDHSPDSAYDSSSNCSDERELSDQDNESDDGWSDEEDDKKYVMSPADLAEFQPAIFAVPHAETEMRKHKLKMLNARWNKIYASEKGQIWGESCKFCFTKKNVRVRPIHRVCTYVAAF